MQSVSYYYDITVLLHQYPTVPITDYQSLYDLQEEDAGYAEENNEIVGDEVGDWNEIFRFNATHFRREGDLRRQCQRNTPHDQERLHVGAEQGADKSCGVRK